MHEQQGLRLGSIFGTTLFLEVSFAILVALFVMGDLQSGAPIEEALLWIPTLFLSVVVHELGHAGMIGALGFGPSVIALGGFGGATFNIRKGRPWQDILISAAGPLTGVAFAFLLVFLANRIAFLQSDRMMATWLPMMISANIRWAIFNLLPIHPLDGGHILRNGTAWVMSDRRSFLITTWISMILCLALLVLGLARQSYFLAIMAGWLLMDNYRRWDRFRQSGLTE